MTQVVTNLPGDDKAPLGRVSLPNRQDMTPEQQVIYDTIVAGPRGQVIGPLRAVIHSPELAKRWSSLGEFLRYDSCIPLSLREIAILATARRWSSPVEWAIHVQVALDNGVSSAALDSIRNLEPPAFEQAEEAAIYEFTRQLLQSGTAGDDIYQFILNRFGDAGMVELTGLVGYYSMVALTLNVHAVPLPSSYENTTPQWPIGQLVELPELGRH